MLRIQITRTGVAGLTKTQLREVGRQAILAAAQYWFEKFLPLHFTKAAYRRYGYAPRAGEPGSGKSFRGSYSEAKLKRRANGQGVQAIGEVKPFVWSGRSRDQALHGSAVTAVAQNFSNYEGRVAIPANTLNFLRGRINADKEMRATHPSEEVELETVFAENHEAGLHRVGRTARTTKTLAA